MYPFGWSPLVDWGDDDYDDLEISKEATPPKESPSALDIDWREAYEKNKTSNKCVVCGKKTINRVLLNEVIKNCRCLDELARAEARKEYEH